MSSTSVRFREDGNKVYITAKDNIPAKIQLERLQTASNLYYKAYNTSIDMDEKVSAAKNMGMVSWRIGKLKEQLQDRSSVIFHFFKEAFQYLTEAWTKSRDVKPSEWRDGISTSAFTIWSDLIQNRLSDIVIVNRVKILYDMLQSIEIPQLRAEFYIHIATCHFHAGVTAIQTKNFKAAMYEMKECYLPVTEAMSLGKNLSLEHITRDAETLESDVTMHQCLAESMQANQIGEELFNKLLMDEENLNIDMVYEVIDWHKQAVLRTREITEVEVEAIALSRIGRVYDKVLKLKAKAKEYLMRSMQLANSMHPRTFHGEGWFEDCKEILARYQKEVVEQESEVWQKERESFLKELEKELQDIKKNDQENTNSRSEGFLKFIYKSYPPTNPANKLEGVPEQGPMTPSDLKKSSPEGGCTLPS